MTDILRAICESEDIELFAFPHMPSIRGSAVQAADGFKMICYDEDAGYWEQQKIIAHEVWHHIAGHLCDHNVSDARDGMKLISVKECELEAKIFAAVFTAMNLFKRFEVTP